MYIYQATLYIESIETYMQLPLLCKVYEYCILGGSGGML